MPVNKDFVLGQLRRVANDRGLKVQGDGAWIRCCWHKNGKEKTPSLKISLVDHPKYGAGSWTCFGCGKDKELKAEGLGGGSWKNLATKLGVDVGEGKKAAQAALNVEEAEEEALDAELFTVVSEKEKEQEKERNKLKKYDKHPSKREWRGIPGKLVRAVGGIDAKNKFGYSRLYLPIKVNGEWNSGVYCTYTKTSMSYVYDGDKRVNRSLFPYDYVKKELKKLDVEDRYIVLVEGPRDALNLLANGVLALAVLGGVTAWNKNKLKLLLDLNVSRVILAPDPDEIGDKLAKQAKKDLRAHVVRCFHFIMDHTYERVKGKRIKKKKEDPGSLSEKRIKQLKREIRNF